MCTPFEFVCIDGADEDCDGRIDCSDPDCGGRPECMGCFPFEFFCSDGRDEGCDGFVDCDDRECATTPDCRECLPFELSCTDGGDDDCDGLFDCDDPECAIRPVCGGCLPIEIQCDDGRDEDCDGRVDCEDPDCAFFPVCGGCLPLELTCDDGSDDDCDGRVDCDDSDCVFRPVCMATTCPSDDLGSRTGMGVARGNTAGAPRALSGSCGGAGAPEVTLRWRAPLAGAYEFNTFGSRYDTLIYLRSACEGPELVGQCNDDASGTLQSRLVARLAAGQEVILVVDGFSSTSFGEYVVNIVSQTVLSERGLCADGADNDRDGLTDCADPDCAGDPFCETMCEPRELGIEMCTDGDDNDCDGPVDCADVDCSPFGPDGECCDGRDDDGDGQTDIFTCRCVDDADCDGVGTLEQVCWASTFSVCGPRCNFYGGDAFCRMVEPSLRCDTSTGECIRL
jgi:hypothetical protein